MNEPDSLTEILRSALTILASTEDDLKQLANEEEEEMRVALNDLLSSKIGLSTTLVARVFTELKKTAERIGP